MRFKLLVKHVQMTLLCNADICINVQTTTTMNVLEIKGFAQSINQMSHPTLDECNKLLSVTGHKIIFTANETEFYHEQTNGGKALLAAKKLYETGEQFTARQILKGLNLNCKDIGQPIEFHILPHKDGGNVICARIKSVSKYEEDIFGID